MPNDALWPTKEARSWAEFLDIVAEVEARSGDFVYRGQSDATWDLKPSLARISSGFSAAMEGERKAYSTFRARSQNFLNPNIFSVLTRHYNIFLWWAVMRHHGVPTRILDWSRSPFIAAYFACESGSEPGAVWCVDRSVLSSQMGSAHEGYSDFNKFLSSTASVDDRKAMEAALYNESASHLITIVDTNFLTDRMERQQGLFSFSNLPHLDHAKEIADALSIVRPQAFLKILIPKHRVHGQVPKHDLIDRKRKFMHQLQLMNVTGFSLFPDLDGIGRYCTDIVRHKLHAK